MATKTVTTAASTRKNLRDFGLDSNKLCLPDSSIHNTAKTLYQRFFHDSLHTLRLFSDKDDIFSAFSESCSEYRNSGGLERCQKFCRKKGEKSQGSFDCPSGQNCYRIAIKNKLSLNLNLIMPEPVPVETGKKMEDPGRFRMLIADSISDKVQLEVAGREIVRLDAVLNTNYRLNEMLTSINDKKRVLETILSIGLDMCGADTGSVMLLDDGGNLRIEIAHTRRPFDPRKVVIPSGKGLTGFSVATGTIINIPDVTKDPRFIQGPDQVGSELIIPLRVKGRVIGVLNFESCKLDAFATEHEITLGMLALHVAAVIENAELYSKIEQKLNEISVLFQVNKAMSSTLDIDRLFPLIIRLIKEIMNVETISLMLVDAMKNELYIKESDGIPEDMARCVRVPMGDGISGWVAENSKPLLVPDVVKHPVSKERLSSLPHNTRSALSVPLTAHGRTIGVINVNNKKSGEIFKLEDQILLEMVAIQVTTAIENARLYEETRRQVAQLSAINEVGRYISSSLDLNIVLNGVVDTIMLLIKSDSASLLLVDGGGKLKPKILRGLDEGYFLAVADQLENGIAGKVQSGRSPIKIENTAKTPDYIKSDDELPKTMLCAPLIARDKVIGIISIERELIGNAQPYTDEHLSLLTILTSQAAVSIENATLYENLLGVYLETVQSLAAAVEAKDSYTSGHSKRVSFYASVIAQQMNLPDEDVKTIRHTALLHDIGKIGIAKQILEKPGNLSSDEWSSIKNHPTVGASILKSVAFLKDVGRQLKHHHERFDGTGYPDGLKGHDIPLGSRIIAVADTFDAMTSTRPYRKGLPFEVALTEIKNCSGTQFDPVVVKAFVAIADEIAQSLNEQDFLEA